MKRLDVHSIGEQQAIAEAVDVLSHGGIVIYPTETTYGVAVDCENPAAVAKLLQYKSNRQGKAISVAVLDQEMASRYVTLNTTAKKLYETFLPGPVTVISKSHGKANQDIESIDGTIGIRIPDYPLALSLVRAFGKGITATGANASNKKRPYSIEDILESISSKQQSLIDLILDVGELPHHEPSTVVDTTLDDVVVLRAGEITFTSKQEFTSHSVEDTFHIASQLISQYRSYFTYTPIVLFLEGEMGAGKTHFVKGIAQGLHIDDTITSPTYSLSNEYHFISEERTAKFHHIDTWRMQNEAEFSKLNIEKELVGKPVVAIEWGERVESMFKETPGAILLRVTIDIVNESTRHITVSKQ